MNCSFEPFQHDGPNTNWRCTRVECQRETGWINSYRAPLATCRAKDLTRQPFTPPDRAPIYQCEHRGQIVGTVKRESCGCDEQPLYKCGLYGEQVTLRRHRKHDGRNCLDCKMDSECNIPTEQT